MTDQGEIALREAVAASSAMADHLRRLRGGLGDLFPIDPAQAAGPDPQVERLHAFLRMFEQLYDVVSRRLFRGLLLMLREDPRELSFKAVVRRLETLGLVDDGDSWFALGATRNMLVHDYASTAQTFSDHLNRAWTDLDRLLAVHEQIVARIRQEAIS